MAEIDLYVDPVCPFAWVTARWLLGTASAEHTVTVEQMSLAVLNEGQSVDAAHAPMLTRSRRFGRLFAAARERHGDRGFESLYSALGARLHTASAQPDQVDVAAALREAQLDAGLVAALDDPAFDAAVAHAHEASQAVLGGRGGSPVIAVDGRGFCGPVFLEPPAGDRAAAVLGAVITLATEPAFAALQRPYQGPPVLTPVEYR